MQSPKTIKRLTTNSIKGISLAAFTWMMMGHRAEAQVQFAEPVSQPFGILEHPEWGNTFVRFYDFVDIDVDGDMDLLISVDGTPPENPGIGCYYYENQGGTFDFNNLRTLNSCMIGNQFFHGFFYSPFYDYRRYLIDLDEDGDLDVYQEGYYNQGYCCTRYDLLAFENTAGIMAGETTGPFTSAGERGVSLGVGYEHFSGWDFQDVNQDGQTDLISTVWDYDDEEVRVQYYTNQDNGSALPFTNTAMDLPALSHALTETEDLAPRRCQYPDLDDDGDLDVLVTTFIPDESSDNYSIEFSYLENVGIDTMSFDTSVNKIASATFFQTSEASYIPRYIYGDVDGDGDLDVFYNEVFIHYTYSGGSNNIDSAYNRLFFVENLSATPSAVYEDIWTTIHTYPNPSRNQILLELGSPGVMKHIMCYDISGKVIYRVDSDAARIQLTKDVLGQGTFIARVRFPDSTGIARLFFID